MIEEHVRFTVERTSYLRNLTREDIAEAPLAIHFQDPPKRNEGTGTTSYSMRFPVLVLTGYLADSDEVAARVAAILNKHWDDDA